MSNNATIREHAADVLTYGLSDYTANYYGLTPEERESLHTYHRQYERIRLSVQTLLLTGYKRKIATFFTYEQHIDEPDPESGLNHYSFIADLAYDHAHMFPDCGDNHEVAELLASVGVLDRDAGDEDDPEMCCYYAYFKTEETARAFIDRLNAFITKRSAK